MVLDSAWHLRAESVLAKGWLESGVAGGAGGRETSFRSECQSLSSGCLNERKTCIHGLETGAVVVEIP